MSNNKQDPIIEKLDQIAKLLSALVVQDKTFREQVRLLSDVGFGPTEIARIIGKDVNTVKVTKSLMKSNKIGGKNGQ